MIHKEKEKKNKKGMQSQPGSSYICTARARLRFVLVEVWRMLYKVEEGVF